MKNKIGNIINRKILGLDIRYDAVSAVLVKSSVKGNWIETCEHVPILDQKEIESKIKYALEKIFEKIDITGCVCVASFPADAVSYRNIQIPFKGQKKIRQILPFELESTLPFPVEDLIIDFHTIKLSDHTDNTDLIAASVERASLKTYLDMLASFKIEPEIVTVGGYPAALCLAKLTDIPEKALFIDIDNKKSTVFAVNSGQICLIRSFPISSDVSSRTVSLCADIQRTVSAFEEFFGFDFQPDRIFVTGCGLDGSNLEDDMARILGLSVSRTDLIGDTDITMKNHPASPWKPEQMDNALALAVIKTERINGLNFRKGPFAVKKHWAEHKNSLIKTGILSGLVLVMICTNILIDSYSMEKQLTRLNDQINNIFKITFPDVKNIVDPLQQMRVKLQDAQKTFAFAGGTENNIPTIDILNHISSLIPSATDVEFNRLVIGPENVAISGNTDTFNSVDDMKNRLEQAEAFKKVTISSANIDKPGNRVRFKLKIDL